MPVENAIITHGHADHARAGHQNVLATQNTIDIMKIRYGHRCANSFQSLEYHKPLKINDLTIESLSEKKSKIKLKISNIKSGVYFIKINLIMPRYLTFYVMFY